MLSDCVARYDPAHHTDLPLPGEPEMNILCDIPGYCVSLKQYITVSKYYIAAQKNSSILQLL